jgi:hypothetical protein
VVRPKPLLTRAGSALLTSYQTGVAMVFALIFAQGVIMGLAGYALGYWRGSSHARDAT